MSTLGRRAGSFLRSPPHTAPSISQPLKVGGCSLFDCRDGILTSSHLPIKAPSLRWLWRSGRTVFLTCDDASDVAEFGSRFHVASEFRPHGSPSSPSRSHRRRRHAVGRCYNSYGYARRLPVSKVARLRAGAQASAPTTTFDPVPAPSLIAPAVPVLGRHLPRDERWL